MLAPHSLIIPEDFQIGDCCRFPLGSLGDDEVYRHRWEVVALGGYRRRGQVLVRRLNDRFERWVAAHWVVRYSLEERAPVATAIDTRRPPQFIKWNTGVPHCCGKDHPEDEAFFVSVSNGESHILLLGPYETHRESLGKVQKGKSLLKRAASSSDPRLPWYSYGTCGMKRNEYDPTKVLFSGESHAQYSA